MLREYFFVVKYRLHVLIFLTVVFDPMTWEVITGHALPEVIYSPVCKAGQCTRSLLSILPTLVKREHIATGEVALPERRFK